MNDEAKIEKENRTKAIFRYTSMHREEWKLYFHNILNCFRVGEMRVETPKENVARRILEEAGERFPSFDISRL